MPISVPNFLGHRRRDAGVRSRSAMHALGADDRIYPTQKIGVLLDALAYEGVPTGRALEGVGLSEHEVADPATRVSLTQVIACCRNAISLSPDPMFAYRTGLRFHLAAYGIYGFAMLSSMDFRQTMRFADNTTSSPRPLLTTRSRKWRATAFGRSPRSRIPRSIRSSIDMSWSCISGFIPPFIAI